VLIDFLCATTVGVTSRDGFLTTNKVVRRQMTRHIKM